MVAHDGIIAKFKQERGLAIRELDNERSIINLIGRKLGMRLISRLAF